MGWSAIAAEFAWDGSWRDIYVVGATVTDWQSVIEGVGEFVPKPSFYINGEPAPLPKRVEDVFEQHQDASFHLALKVGGVGLKSHFFDDEEIEFDLDPREVKGPAQLEALIGFMRFLAATTSKAAILTHENTKDAVILSVTPADSSADLPNVR